MNEIAVIGAGAWGTALAIQAVRAGNRVRLWARDPARATAIMASRQNPRLSEIALPDSIVVTHEMPEDAAAYLLVVPTQHMRAVVAQLPARANRLVVCAKGVEAGTLRLPLEILAERRPGATSAVLTGPNFAHEVAAGLPAAAVVAATDAALREDVARMLGTATFRLYGNDDPVGAQLGGAAKNVIAIAAGAVIGAGLGENARAALITRGLVELSRLAVALGGRAETVMGLSGLGDLLLTCTGPSSRNFSLGHALGRGESLTAVLATRSAVTEGATTAPALIARAAGLDLPICTAVADFLAGRLTLVGAIAALLARPRRDE
ncbi:MAG: NAD(P)H-dependent glycerol-3-phosphate dehydrogenase [Acetobacteraceae bacterium]|nr:NAD(P)H-dependent glycerol-3-phosphate dehydrogenase [Acetobacteraceae bacterium]MSP30112.1 NAD(P)H-dependent glycerol-3-phosphate dehydrogenase [Acetobacteraceae bacterium]